MTTQTISPDDQLLTTLFTSGDMSIVDKIASRIISLQGAKDLIGAMKLEKRLIETVQIHGIGSSYIKKIIKSLCNQEKEEQMKIDLDVTESVVEEMNVIHAVVSVGKFYILTECEDRKYGGSTFYLHSKQSFRDHYQNKTVSVGEEKKVSKADIWLNSLNRREFKGIEFNPDLKKASPDYYNLWRGFAVEPIQGCCEKYKAFVKEVVCGGDPVSYSYLWCWCARLVQHPELVGMVAILLMGGQGIGKGTWIYPLSKILGSHFIPLSSVGKLVGKFNEHLKHGVLIHANEAFWNDNIKKVGDLKAMITEEDKALEGKGQNVIIVRNFSHLIFSSNDPWPVHLDCDDRRFFVRELSPHRKKDKKYFREIYKELNNGGFEALLYELLNTDISEFDPTEVPHTTDAFGVKLLSVPSPERYIFESLKMGSFELGKNEFNDHIMGWTIQISTVFLYTDYKQWCGEEGIKYMSSEFLGKALKKLIPSMRKTRERYRENEHNTYHFPPLAKAREEFEEAFKANESIWEEHIHSVPSGI